MVRLAVAVFVWSNSARPSWATPTYRGHDGLRQMLDDVDVAWETLRSEPVEIAVHGEVVVMTYRLSGRGRTSGADIEGELVW
jgi:hypothetical protein